MRLAKALCWALVALAAGCEKPGVVGSGVAATERREVASFDEVEFTGAMEVELSIGELAPVEITADDNILPLIASQVSGNRLDLGSKERLRPKTPIKVKLQAPSLKAIECIGAVTLSASGLHGKVLAVELTGASKVKPIGKVERFTVSTTGAGDVQAAALEADHVEVTITGAGEADVHALQTLRVSMSGAGVVRYVGDPKVEKSIAGVGTVVKK